MCNISGEVFVCCSMAKALCVVLGVPLLLGFFLAMCRGRLAHPSRFCCAHPRRRPTSGLVENRAFLVFLVACGAADDHPPLFRGQCGTYYPKEWGSCASGCHRLLAMFEEGGGLWISRAAAIYAIRTPSHGGRLKLRASTTNTRQPV